jgi:hypothetical protein
MSENPRYRNAADNLLSLADGAAPPPGTSEEYVAASARVVAQAQVYALLLAADALRDVATELRAIRGHLESGQPGSQP